MLGRTVVTYNFFDVVITPEIQLFCYKRHQFATVGIFSVFFLCFLSLFLCLDQFKSIKKIYEYSTHSGNLSGIKSTILARWCTVLLCLSSGWRLAWSLCDGFVNRSLVVRISGVKCCSIDDRIISVNTNVSCRHSCE